MYLDDGIGVGVDLNSTIKLSESVRNDLILSGFIINDKKCILVSM